jgi:CubicO group peptidase (beta-lactamase class C family)
VVQNYVRAGDFEGTVLVAERGEIIYEKGFGSANRDSGAPNGPDTRFMIASVTKQFTALLVMQLVGERAIDLDAPISDYLPYYRKDTGATISVRHLLQHTSGLPEGVVEWDQIDDAMVLAGDRPEFVRRFWMGDPTFSPGTDFSYTNTDYGLLGVILEEVTGSSFEDLLSQRILDPLEMKDSGMVAVEMYVPGLATGYVKTENGIETRPYLGQPGYAAAGMFSTARDLFRWNQALLNNELLSPELTTTMFTPIVGINPTTGNYVAFGSWVYERRLSDGQGIRLIERHGYISPFTALNVVAPDHGHSIIILSNVDPADIHGLSYAPGLPYDLLLALYDLPTEGPQ